MALYNTCEPDYAHIFVSAGPRTNIGVVRRSILTCNGRQDHGKGHTLPREKAVIKELGDTIRNMIAEVA